MATVDLACTKAALIKKANPSTNYHGATEYQLAGAGASPYDNFLLLGFESLTGTDRYKSIINVQFCLTADRNLGSTNYLYFNTLDTDFNESTATWNNTSTSGTHFYNGAPVTSGSGDEATSVVACIDSIDQLDGPAAGLAALQAPGIWVKSSSIASGERYLNVYTNAATSSKRPYLRALLSDSIADVSVSRNSVGRFDYTKAATFSWGLNFTARSQGGYYRGVADIVQTSATFYWREKGTSNWNSRSVSGDTRSITVPGNTFPARDIEWRVTPVVTGYNVTGTGATSYSTAYPRIVSDMEATRIAEIREYEPDTTFPWNGNTIISYWSDMIGSPMAHELLVSFDALPSSYKYKAIDQAGISVKTYISPYTTQGANLYFLNGGFDETTATWNTQPGHGQQRGQRSYKNDNRTTYSFSTFYIQANRDNGAIQLATKAVSKLGLEAINAPGFQLTSARTTDQDDIQRNSFSVYDPVIRRAYLLDTTVTSKPAATTNASGYVNPHVAQVFSWEHVPNGDYWCVGTWTTASATFKYRAQGASTWTSKTVTAGSSSYTLAANSMGTGTYEWCVTATDSAGTQATSDTYTINTADTAHTATPLTPNGSLENGDGRIRFIWSDASETGAAPGGADLQYSTDDGVNWTTFAEPRTSATQYDAAAGAIPTGTVIWRVRSYSADSTAGSWSDPLSFLCFAAPDPPIVTADGKPLLTITWQSAEQQAYEVTVDGVKYGPYFGTEKSFQVPEYLSNGSHVVSVRTENQYSLWSQPGTTTTTVTNVPGAAITLSGIFDRDAELYWTMSGSGEFLIYRDDVLIGHTSTKGFTDRTSLGYHSWKVVRKMSGGYYTASNIVNGKLSVNCLTIAALGSDDWLELAKTDASDRSVVWSHNQNVSLRQFAGQEYPNVEIAPYKTMSVSFDVAWSHGEESSAAAFAQLIGKPVILKDPIEGVMVGILTAWQRSNTIFYRAYTVTVQRIHWRDYTDADS